MEMQNTTLLESN
jgi:hypothetical protein